MHKRSRARTRNFVGDTLASLKIGIWSWRGSTSNVHCCPVAARLFNVPIEAGWKGLSLDRYAASVHPDDRVRFVDLIDQAQRTGGPFVAEYRTLDANGTTRSVLDRGEFQLGPGGRTVAACGMVVDLTDRPEALEIERSVLSTTQFHDLPALHQAVEYGLALHRLLEVFPDRKKYAAQVLLETFLEMLGSEISVSLERDAGRAVGVNERIQ